MTVYGGGLSVGKAIVAPVLSLTIVMGIGSLVVVAVAAVDVKVADTKSGRYANVAGRPPIETSGVSTIHSADDLSGVEVVDMVFV